MQRQACKLHEVISKGLLTACTCGGRWCTVSWGAPDPRVSPLFTTNAVVWGIRTVRPIRSTVLTLSIQYLKSTKQNTRRPTPWFSWMAPNFKLTHSPQTASRLMKSADEAQQQNHLPSPEAVKVKESKCLCLQRGQNDVLIICTMKEMGGCAGCGWDRVNFLHSC